MELFTKDEVKDLIEIYEDLEGDSFGIEILEDYLDYFSQDVLNKLGVLILDYLEDYIGYDLNINLAKQMYSDSIYNSEFSESELNEDVAGDVAGDMATAPSRIGGHSPLMIRKRLREKLKLKNVDFNKVVTNLQYVGGSYIPRSEDKNLKDEYIKKIRNYARRLKGVV
jgi:hypothetical protein